MKQGPLYVLICYLMWGTIPIFWKQLAEVDALYLLATRMVWSALFMGAFLALRRKFGEVRAVVANKKECVRLILAGICIGANWGIYIWAVTIGRMLDASLAYYMNPILAVLLGAIVFRERLTRLQWLSVAVTFAGPVIVVAYSGQFPWLALAIGGSFAIYGAMKKGVQHDVGVSMLVETTVPSIIALPLLVMWEIQGVNAVGILHGAQWLLLPATGIISTVPLLFFSVGMKTTSMTLAGILMYINPTLQMMVSVFIYHEEFTTNHAVLFCFAWVGVALYMLSEALERKKVKALCA